MRRGLWLLLALLLVSPLAGCGKRQETDEVNIYYPVEASDQYDAPAIREELWLDGPEQPTPEELIGRMALPPTDEGLAPVFPEGTVLRDWSLKEGLLTLNFSEAYNELTGISLTLGNYCAVLTCAQLPGVEQVAITVEGEPLTEGNPGPFRASEVLLSGNLNPEEMDREAEDLP